MSTPDTPSHDNTPDASAASSHAPNEPQQTSASRGNGSSSEPGAHASSEPHASESHASSTGEESSSSGSSSSGSASGEHGSQASSESESSSGSGEGEGEGGSEHPHEEGAAEGAAATGDPAKKRRRRRRRKKGAGAPGAEGHPEGEGASAEGQPAAEGEGAEAKPGDKPERREHKREKKAGPPRERPPVNAGDIVFGKILEITDDAILIDIPGKAHAIFDRREMLLTDEEDGAGAGAAARARPTGAIEAVEGTAQASGGEAPGEAPAGEAPAAEPVATEHALETGASAEAPNADAVEATAVDTPAEASTTARAEGADEAGPQAAGSEAEAQAGEEPKAPEPEPTREPKVPRVILEVGADFIGVVHNDGARGGLVVLTHHPKRAERAKPAIEKAANEKTTIQGLVTGVIKGGIEVDVDGLRAFAPGSHVDLRLGADLSHLVAKRLPFYVTQYAKRGRDVVLSRKSLLEEESRKARSEALSKLKVGEERDGIVRSVVQFGAFIDVGGVEGLVPLQEMSHNRGDGPSDVFKVGEPTRVVVMKIDDRGKIWLSRRATIPDPWQQVAKKYAQGTKHAGKVVRLQPFGAFIELEPGVDGLLHTADLSVKRIETPDEVVKVGDAIDVVVAHVDPMNHKIALHPAPTGEAADEAPQKVAPHKPVKAKVVTIESGGLVVRILGVTGRNARGYVPAGGTGTPRGTELRKAFNVGQAIDAKVIEMDPRRGEIKLSIKALSEDQERNAYQQYRQQLKAEARFTFGDLLAKKNPPR